MKTKVLISTGGSGGHVIPAITIYNHLQHTHETLISTDVRGLKYLEKNYKAVIINTPKLNNSISPVSSRKRSSLSSQLVGWQRNPFNAVATSSEADIDGASITSEEEKDIEKSILLKNLERYNVEIVAEFNNEKIVLIDNRRFRQGEYLNSDILIDRIENDQITFRNGSTTVTRNVGN